METFTSETTTKHTNIKELYLISLIESLKEGKLTI
jgi:hypothetical protein